MKKASSRSSEAPRPKTRKAAPARKPAVNEADADEMRPEYDFRGGVRGKYAGRFTAGRPVRAVVLAPDVAEAFGSARSVNAALRRVLRERERAEGRVGGSRRPA
jgi:hypothetical protein